MFAYSGRDGTHATRLPAVTDAFFPLVDPLKESGQSLYRQYVGKKGKIVLNAQWVIRCVEAGALQTYHSNFGDCKVTGTEKWVVPLTPSSVLLYLTLSARVELLL